MLVGYEANEEDIFGWKILGVSLECSTPLGYDLPPSYN